MHRYSIEVSNALKEKIKQNAVAQNISEEEFIAQILSRYVVEAHIMEKSEVKEGYEVCGAMNIEIANL